MVKIREVFLKNLEESDETIRLVADWMKNSGFDLDILPHDVAPNEESRFEYIDNGDIIVKQRVEVKYWKNINFHSIEDIPYENIIVDEKYKIDKRSLLTLLAYVILNSSRSACIIIFRNTYKSWFTDTKYDRKEGSNRTYYFCPKSKVEFSKIFG